MHLRSSSILCNQSSVSTHAEYCSNGTTKLSDSRANQDDLDSGGPLLKLMSSEVISTSPGQCVTLANNHVHYPPSDIDFADEYDATSNVVFENMPLKELFSPLPSNMSVSRITSVPGSDTQTSTSRCDSSGGYLHGVQTPNVSIDTDIGEAHTATFVLDMNYAVQCGTEDCDSQTVIYV